MAWLFLFLICRLLYEIRKIYIDFTFYLQIYVKILTYLFGYVTLYGKFKKEIFVSYFIYVN